MVDGQQDLMKDAKSLGFTEFFLLLKMLEQLFAFDQLANNVVIFGVLLHAIDFYNVWVILGLDYCLPIPLEC